MRPSRLTAFLCYPRPRTRKTPHQSIPYSIAQALRATLPDAELDTLEFIGKGWSQIAYRVTVSGENWLLKYPIHSLGKERQETRFFRTALSVSRIPIANARSLEDLEREFHLLPELEKWGLPTPQDAHGLRDNQGRLVAMAHRHVAGVTANPKLVRGRKRNLLAKELAAFFTRLHQFPRERALTLGIRDTDLWNDQYQELIEFCRPMLGTRTNNWLTQTTERFQSEGGTTGGLKVLIHGDISADHILLNPNGELQGIIDFGDAMIADPALDFAGLLNQFSWPFVERVLGYYKGRIDAGMRHRAEFYVSISPLFSVRYGDIVRGGQERADGLKRLTARAAAATRMLNNI